MFILYKLSFLVTYSPSIKEKAKLSC